MLRFLAAAATGFMERTTFLEHYRICLKNDGTPRELSRTGPAITYKAIDDRFGETVALKLIPSANIDPATREQFEEEVRAIQRLNHVNIAKVFDSGHEDGNFVYASEYVPGDMLDSWIEEHGPMPADAVLRVALQVVSALSSANFHKLTVRAIQPSNLMVVPGSTPEGDWPFVRIMDFGLAGLKLASEGSADEQSFSVAPQFASPEQLQNGTVDFRSEIYSLGATMYFLLTGATPSAELRRQQLRAFPKALRNLLAQMLRDNPDERPKDPVVLAEMIRECLVKIERRQGFARKLGVPLAATIPRKPLTQRSPLAQVWFGALAVAGLLLITAVVGSFLLPDLIPLWHRTAATNKIGVPIGVPDASSEPPKARSAAPIVANQPLTNSSSAPTDLNQNPSPNVQQAEASNAQPEAAATPANSVNESSNTSTTAAENSAQAQDNLSAQAEATPQPPTASESGSRSKKKSIASTSRRARAAQNSFYGQTRSSRGSTYGRFVGTTRDGKFIFRLPSGRTAIIDPQTDGQEDFRPRRHRRAFIDREETFSPPSDFAPDYPFND